jgi:hypothetical protein
MNSIKLFESKNIRSVWNEAEEKWYFSVQDVVSILTETVDPKDYIKKIKKRDLQLNNNWGTIFPLVEMVAGHGPEKGGCTGGVLNFSDSKNISVKNSVLFGSGTEGITAEKVKNLNCNNTIIRGCTYSIMRLNNCTKIKFNNCEFSELL